MKDAPGRNSWSSIYWFAPTISSLKKGDYHYLILSLPNY